MSVIVDGVDKVREAAREELRKGASQLKVFVSGGVVFPAKGHPTRYEFSEAELAAAVEEAAARSTYVMAHVYSDEGVRRCLKAGVRSIEHGNFASEETVALIAQSGAFLDMTFISLVQRIESGDGKSAFRGDTIENNSSGRSRSGHQVRSMGERSPCSDRISGPIYGVWRRRSRSSGSSRFVPEAR